VKASTRLWSLVSALLALTVATLSGCGSQETARGPITVPQDGVVRIASRRLPPGLANPAAHSGQPSVDIWPAFYDAMTFVDRDGQVQPWLALRWELIDPTTWRFHLRDGVMFSNGEPFDAHAVQAAVDHILLGYGAKDLVRSSLLPTVASARVVDRLTIDILTKKPDPLLPKRVSQFYPLPPAYFAEVGPQQFARQPIGTGPFIVEEWGVGRVRMRANPNSWRPPRVKGLEFIEIPDTTARRQAIESGQVHIAQYLAPEDIQDLVSLGIEMRPTAEPRLRMLVFVVRPGSPLASRDVRLAFNYAVNKQAIVGILLAGSAPVATQIGVRASEGFDSARAPYPYDPVRARELLAKAGYPDGFSINVDVLAPTNTDRTVFESVAADLRDVGIDARMHTMEFERWRANLLSGNWRNDMFTWSVGLDPLLDISRAWQYLACTRERPPFCQPQVSKLVAQRAVEMDPARRAALMRQINDLLYDDPPVVLLHELTNVTGVVGLRDYEVHNLIVRWDRLDLERSAEAPRVTVARRASRAPGGA
jgi:peptide/nickel transport system substrate-binding protein